MRRRKQTASVWPEGKSHHVLHRKMHMGRRDTNTMVPSDMFTLGPGFMIVSGPKTRVLCRWNVQTVKICWQIHLNFSLCGYGLNHVLFLFVFLHDDQTKADKDAQLNILTSLNLNHLCAVIAMVWLKNLVAGLEDSVCINVTLHLALAHDVGKESEWTLVQPSAGAHAWENCCHQELPQQIQLWWRNEHLNNTSILVWLSYVNQYESKVYFF